MNIIRTAGAAVIVVAVGAVAFTVLDDPTTKADPQADSRALRANATAGAASFAGDFPALADMLPNAKLPDGTSTTDAVVVGTITAVVPEAGYDELYIPNAPAPGKPGARVTTFDDPLADWRTLRVTVDVEEMLSGQQTQQLNVSWSLLGSSTKGEDAAAIGRALKALGRVVILTTSHTSDPANLGITRDVQGKEGCVIKVAPDGTLSLPLAGGSEEGARIVDPAAYLSDVRTLDQLRAQAAKPDHPSTQQAS